MASTACMVEAWSNQVIEIHEMHVSQLCEPWKQALDAMKEIQVSQRAGCDSIFSSKPDRCLDVREAPYTVPPSATNDNIVCWTETGVLCIFFSFKLNLSGRIHSTFVFSMSFLTNLTNCTFFSWPVTMPEVFFYK